MLSGRLASRFNVYDSGHEFGASNPTLMHHLRALGYQTALSGKMHFIGPDQLHGYEERLNTDIYPSRFSWIADWEQANRQNTSGALKGHQTLDDRVRSGGKVIRTLQLDHDEETDFLAKQKIYDLARQGSEAPFFLTVSFSHPHDPFEATEPFWNLYQEGEIPMPSVARISPENADAHSARLMEMYGADHDILSDHEIRRARHAYFASISYIDSKVGGLMATLKETGLDDNTIVVFTSDHGEMLGERGLWFKFCFFEWAMRVPMIVRLPGGQGRGVIAAGHSSLVDLLPTLVDLASDGQAFDSVVPLDGKSLIDAFQQGGHTGSETTFAEYNAEGSLAPQVMVRERQYKLTTTRTDPTLLFDLEADPMELNNVAEDPAFAEVRCELEQKVSANWDVKQLEIDILASQKKHLFVGKTLSTGSVVHWNHQPGNNADYKYVRTKPGIDKAAMRLPKHSLQ